MTNYHFIHSLSSNSNAQTDAHIMHCTTKDTSFELGQEIDEDTTTIKRVIPPQENASERLPEKVNITDDDSRHPPWPNFERICLKTQLRSNVKATPKSISTRVTSIDQKREPTSPTLPSPAPNITHSTSTPSQSSLRNTETYMSAFPLRSHGFDPITSIHSPNPPIDSKTSYSHFFPFSAPRIISKVPIGYLRADLTTPYVVPTLSVY
mmetsp:Transcript_46058/g.55857  ORF Transcript_46058/g.55857 Transcript_46058/m.55857 type:complete len:208 (-) Transcript_46058:35-658(-)